VGQWAIGLTELEQSRGPVWAPESKLPGWSAGERQFWLFEFLSFRASCMLEGCKHYHLARFMPTRQGSLLTFCPPLGSWIFSISVLLGHYALLQGDE